MNHQIFITGATGNIGREVVIALGQHGAAMRLAKRSDRPNTSTASYETAKFDFVEPSTFAPAVSGCTSVFLLRPPAITDTRATLNRFIDVARDVGVTQIVFVSVAGAADNCLVPHHAVEQHLRNGRDDWTILRPGFFAQNLEIAYRQNIVANDCIYVPAGRGRVAFIDTRDIAAVAVEALLHPAIHVGQAYTLTGPAALSFADVAALLTAELDRNIGYEAASVIGYIRHLLDNDLPLAHALVQAILHFGLRFGQAEKVNGTLEKLLGRPAGTMASYIHEQRAMWHSFPAGR